MIWTLIETISVVCGITGATLTTSTTAKTRALGFSLFMLGSVCSLLIYQQASLYIMFAQSCVFMVINVRGIRNNLNRGN